MELSTKYKSTVFMCETTQDSRYVRCDFNQCKTHFKNTALKLPVEKWIRNTEKNVGTLEEHVGNEVYTFVNSLETEKQLYELNTQWINNHLIGGFPKKVVIVFNLRDAQSSFGIWIHSFLKVCCKDISVYHCIALSFSSRKELLLQIARLSIIRQKLHKSEVLCVLSSHSSSQGQVFSCTPTLVSKKYGFEEFCSLHDFVCACQDVLGDCLRVVHISSCFTMKLNESHKDWPVSCSWLNDELRCALGGSAKEVYETGSQTSDLFIIVALVTSACNMRHTYTQLFAHIAGQLYPDLLMEMGLSVMNPHALSSMLENPDREDQVTPFGLVECSVDLVLIANDSDDSSLLREAITHNLHTRIADLSAHVYNINTTLDSVVKKLYSIPVSSKKLFVVVLSKNASLVLQEMRGWICENKSRLYGLHVNYLEDKSYLESVGSDLSVTYFKCGDLAITSPPLLYLIQLSLGENGARELQEKSDWSLKEVFKEACHVIPGLCEQASFSFYQNSDVVELTQIKTISGSQFSGNLHNKIAYTDDKTICKNIPNFIINNEKQNKITTRLPNFNIENKSISLKIDDDKKLPVETLIPCVVDRYKKEIDDTHNDKTVVSSPIKNGLAQTKLADHLEIDEKKDVPLMANVDEVLVYHYVLNLDVSFETKSLLGSILLFVKPASERAARQAFQMCLDCTLIDIVSVERIVCPAEATQVHLHGECCCANVCAYCTFIELQHTERSSMQFKVLPYALYGWCVKVWDPEDVTWPRCVRIKYRTKSTGPSLMWAVDSEGNACAFTPGAYINNRSMMPCQEPPVAMATWQAMVYVPRGNTVLSSGDRCPCKEKRLRKVLEKNGKDLFYYEMSIPLPSSTLAFMFGQLSQSSSLVSATPNKQVPVTFYAPASSLDAFCAEYLQVAREYLSFCCAKLGSYMFTRLDVVLMPRCFACMGLQSPNLMFLSRSVLCGDASMRSRVAHEISHTWFGLLVGARDWTEEWLSEGFATYVEDRIVAAHENMSDETFEQYSSLVQTLKRRVLRAELEVTEDDNMKLLRPKRSHKYKTAAEAVESYEATPQAHTVVPNAAIASKKWSQVHYLKGYFLLMYLAKKVTFESFDCFLKHYLQRYSGQLVTSEMFFDFYVNYFNLESGFKEETIRTWLESSNLPEIASIPGYENPLKTAVEKEFLFWKSANTTNKRNKSRGLKRKRKMVEREKLSSHQLVLLLEMMLEIEEILPQTLTQLKQVYSFANKNAEVRHRWCELIVKHNHVSKFDDVKDFLIYDQGMGVYLFGELMLSGKTGQSRLAKQIYDVIASEMDKSTRETVRQLINEEETE